MLINFCRSSLKTSIECTCLTNDAGEAENLLTESAPSFHHPLGFMAEYYIKCPVEIVLNFPCLVDISSVVVEPKLSAHRTRAFEIYSVYQKPSAPQAPVSDAPKNSGRACAYPCTYPLDFASPTVRTRNRFMMNFMAKYSEPGNQQRLPERIIIRNSRHPEQYVHRDSHTTAYVESRQHTSIQACSNLVLILTWATVPVLKKLQVWGTPSRLNAFTIIERVQMLAAKPSEPPSPIVVEDLDSPIADTGDESSQSHASEALFKVDEIPEEFMDPITCQLMSVPMLLPSGNNVDNSTLDRYVEEEAKFGRRPSDPFTGVVFSDYGKPVPNGSLKARIDLFVLRNASRIEASARTTGFKDASLCDNTLDKVKHFIRKRACVDTGEAFGCGRHIKEPRRNSASILPSDGRSTGNSSQNAAHAADVNVDYDYSVDGRTLPPLPPPPSLQAPGGSHESELQNSLDLSLSKALSSLPLALTHSPGSSSPSVLKCESCGCEEVGRLFRIVCRHLFCRPCIQQLLISQQSCSKCKAPFRRQDVIKVP